MPIKNYHTVDGEIIGETTGGTRTDFLTGPNGEVTATVDQNANVVNTYRYKPFGLLLAKTGVATDPRFMWRGRLLMRTTMVPVFDYELYGGNYAGGSGTISLANLIHSVGSRSIVHDLFNREGGTQHIIVTFSYQTRQPVGCSGATFSTPIDIFATPGSVPDGWIVQCVNFFPKIELCTRDCNSAANGPIEVLNGGAIPWNFDYCEGWRVVKGRAWKTRRDGSIVDTPFARDVITHAELPANAQVRGSQLTSALFKFFKGDVSWDPGFVTPRAPDQPVRRDPPPGWGKLPKPGQHMLKNTFNCCTTPPTNSLESTPVPDSKSVYEANV